jgi:hypothetical protein
VAAAAADAAADDDTDREALTAAFATGEKRRPAADADVVLI